MLSNSERLVVDISRELKITIDRKPYAGVYACRVYLYDAEIFSLYDRARETAFRKCVGMLHGDLQMLLYKIDEYVADLDEKAPWLYAVPVEE